ncbi:3-keto-steroid reductase [Byssothecium circinans]|uniref:3-keto-steroid reductase n=1 Tax=Byssothecium circinans TaxID=147558 RepID=A0A6A5TJV5_9PLEO|nr:3-keto-steroid reductase [Byssothecium circinans]
MSLADITQPDSGFYVLITGANSGLGLGVGTRLIDEFLQSRPQNESLVLIVTTRDQRKGDATIEKLHKHVQNVCRKAEKSIPGISMVLQRRVHLRQERLDLLSLVSVQKLAKRLRETTPKLDAVVCNAGIGGWTGLNWPKAVWEVLTDMKNATVWPKFKIAGVGWVTKPQIPNIADGKTVEEPPLAEVFCANFFGHYMLGHYLAPLLSRHPVSEETRGRLIWTSSVDAYKHSFDINDLQGFKATEPYESSKRLADLMGITSRFSSTAPLVNKYLSHPPQPTEKTTQPRIYLAHPGIVATSIVPLPLILEYCMILAFYIGRWLGQQWHCVTVHKAAVSMVWLTLAKQSTLDTMEEREGVAKWGSATDVWGNERVERTEVSGWGWGGKLGEKSRKGRSPYATDLTKEEHGEFLELGERCWEKVEELREEWEDRLEEAGVGVGLE